MIEVQSLRWLLICLLGASLPGCGIFPTHLHDPGRLKLAEEVRDEMAQYRANAPNMYAAMLENLERFKREEDWLIGELAANSDTAFVTRIPTAKGSELRADLEDLRTEIGNLQTVIYSGAATDADSKAKRKVALNGAKKAVNAAKAEVKNAKDAVTKWNGQVALLQGLIERIPDLKGTLSSDDVDHETILEKLRALKDVEISFKDADGKEKKKKTGDLLKELGKEWGGDQPADLSPFAGAPGLSVEIAVAGLELAEIEQKRASAELEYLKQRAVLMEDTLLLSELASELVNMAQAWALPEKDRVLNYVAVKRATAPRDWKQSIHGAKDRKATEDEIRENAKKLRAEINAVHRLLVSLRYHAVARSIVRRQQAIYPLELARLDHQRSIVRSKLADEAWQALVGTGLESLVAFHRGGWKQEHIANFIRLAQAGALIAIAN